MFFILENLTTALKFFWHSLRSFDVYGCVYCSARLMPSVICSSSLKSQGLLRNILLIKDIEIYYIFGNGPCHRRHVPCPRKLRAAVNFFVNYRWQLLLYMVVYIAQHDSCHRCYVPRPWKFKDCYEIFCWQLWTDSAKDKWNILLSMRQGGSSVDNDILYMGNC